MLRLANLGARLIPDNRIGREMSRLPLTVWPRYGHRQRSTSETAA
jgi:hypothetical protein